MYSLFFEILIAPDFQPEALDLLKSKKNRIILKQNLKMHVFFITMVIFNLHNPRMVNSLLSIMTFREEKKIAMCMATSYSILHLHKSSKANTCSRMMGT